MAKQTKKQKAAAAKKGAATRKRNASKKKGKGGGRARPKQHLGATLGGAKTAYDVAMAGTLDDVINTIKSPSIAGAKVTAVRAVANLKANATPAVFGAVISFGEDVPLVGPLYNDVVKKPLNKFLGKMEKKLTHRKRRWWI